jgi:hypothetical protein
MDRHYKNQHLSGKEPCPNGCGHIQRHSKVLIHLKICNNDSSTLTGIDIQRVANFIKGVETSASLHIRDDEFRLDDLMDDAGQHLSLLWCIRCCRFLSGHAVC